MRYDLRGRRSGNANENRLLRVDEFMGVADGGRRVAVVRPETRGNRGFHDFAAPRTASASFLSEATTLHFLIY